MLLSVFTPTFNRLSTFSRIISLISQEKINIQWIVVDGGNDGTDSLLSSHCFPANINLVYIKQKSYGLHGAYNEAIELAEGDYFVALHSDDKYTINALETMCYLLNLLTQVLGVPIGGIVSTCIDQYANKVSALPFPLIVSTWRDFIYKFSEDQQIWPLVHTSVIKKYQFPERSDIRFYAEGIMWREISEHSPFVFVDSPLRIYYIDEAESNSLMGMPLTRSKALSLVIYMHYILANDCAYIFYKPIFFLKVFVNYIRYSLHSALALFRFKMLPLYVQILSISLFPLGFLRFVCDKYKSILKPFSDQ